MQVREIYDILDELSPFALQEKWDNSGLLVGDMNLEVQRVYLSLDIDLELIESMEENSLIIVHHPLIFNSLKSVNFTNYPSNIIQKMIKKDISLIAMHTNFDKTHLNEYVATKILGFEIKSKDDFIAYFRVDMSFDELCLHVKDSFGIENLKVVSTKKYIKDCALTTGSGGDLIDMVDAECFLSGDFKYHQALAAKENGLSLIDIGHYESERFFGEVLETYLKNLPLKVIMSNSKNPFEYK